MVRGILFFIYVTFSSFWVNMVFCQEQSQQLNAPEAKQETLVPLQEEPKYVGEFFDLKVSQQNYFFVKSVLTVFGNRGAPLPEAAEEREKIIWGELLLSYEAFRRGIMLEQQEVDGEIGKMLEAEKVTFDWKKDKDAFEEWVKEKVNEPAALFENQIRHLLQIEKLRRTVMESIEPKVLEKEAYQEFLNEQSNLGTEIIQFDNEKAAQEFYRRACKNNSFWEEEKKKRPGDFKQPGSVSVEFLIDIWKYPQEAVSRMMKMRPGQIHPPVAIYKSYGVLKVLDHRPADKSAFRKLKNSYYEQIKTRKKYAEWAKWFEDLKRQAKIKIYNTVITKRGGEKR